MENIKIGLDLGLSSIKIIITNNKKEILIRKLVDNDKCDITLLDEYLIGLLNKSKVEYIVEQVIITGIGQNRIDKVLNTRPIFVDEIQAIGYGAQVVSSLNDCIVVSIGTGTAFVNCHNNVVEHIGGSALGGGTIIGIGDRMFNTTRFKDIINYAVQGEVNKSDRMIKKDYTKNDGSNMLITASNLGNASEEFVNDFDIMIGCIKMVVQNVCIMAALYAKQYQQNNIVITGSLANLEQVYDIAKDVGILHDVNFIVGKSPMYTTLTGAMQLSEKEE
ncbi:hypothetical protein [Mycoplasma sp. P36-A1]|uniref:hypothetical protein n=1 Tax=Mycoplasma sp. P36-A1 TaxID=3252900 RepID=UPI003C2EC65C